MEALARPRPKTAEPVSTSRTFPGNSGNAALTIASLSGPEHSDPAMERQVLAILLKVPSVQADLLDTLTPEDFADPANQMILRAAQSLRNDRQRINPVTVAGILKQSGEYDSLGGAKLRLAELHAETPDASFASEYCEFLQDWRERRAVLLVVQMAAISGLHPQSSPRDVVEQFEQAAHIIFRDDRATGDDLLRRSDVLTEVERNILTPDVRPLVKTGFVAIDSQFGGLRPQELTLVGGRPGSGKSAFGLSLAHNTGVEQGIPTVYCSYEMGRQQIWNREVGWLAKIDHRLFERDVTLSPEQQQAVRTAITRLKVSQLYIDSRPGPSLQQLRQFVRRVVDTYGAKVIIVDQASKLRADMKNRQRIDELSAITDAGKSLSVEFNVSMVFLHQLNRESEQGAYSRPSMKHLKGSGSFEEDADNIMLCYRPEYYGFDTFDGGAEDAKGKGDIQIEKFRNGEPKVCRLAYIAHHTRWDDLSVYDNAPTHYGDRNNWP